MHRFRGSVLRRLLLVAALLLAIGSLAACGDDDGDGDKAATASTRPEDVKAFLSEVLAKLPRMVAGGETAAAAATKGDFDQASQQYDELHEIWEEVERRVKDADLAIYEKIETAQGLIRDGAESKNLNRVKRGAKDQAEAVKAFIVGNGS